jgi:hypothetical protein
MDSTRTTLHDETRRPAMTHLECDPRLAAAPDIAAVADIIRVAPRRLTNAPWAPNFNPTK